MRCRREHHRQTSSPQSPLCREDELYRIRQNEYNEYIDRPDPSLQERLNQQMNQEGPLSRSLRVVVVAIGMALILWSLLFGFNHGGFWLALIGLAALVLAFVTR